MPPPEEFYFVVEPSDDGKRLDVYLAGRLSGISRTLSADMIQKGMVRVEGVSRKPGYRIHSGEMIDGTIPPPERIRLDAEPIPLAILFEDEDLIVLDKPAGMVVHPGPGHLYGTLVSGLLHYRPEIGPIGGELRPGIVHRLDKDTSGVMVVAKNASAHSALSDQFAARTVRKDYLAIVYGEVQADSGCIDLPVGRHPVDRKRMSIRSRRPRRAETHWRVRERFPGITFLQLQLKTGRTHQARVHCAALNHAIVGDPVYGSRKSARMLPRKTAVVVEQAIRQMLHARRLQILHPTTRKPMCFEAPLPTDMEDLLALLRENTLP